MGCSQRHSRIFFSLLVFLISSSAQVRFMAEGRHIHKSMETAAQMGTDQEKALIVRVSIGSRPPRCERVRCNSCTHCEAIQVPAIPQNKKSSSDKIKKDEQLSKVATRGDDSSNYKPMSWKCKCGNLIFNP